MTLEEMKFAFTVGNTVLTFVIGFYVYLSNRNRVTNERITALEGHVDRRLDNHADRLARVEKQVELGPNHDDINRLHKRVDDVAQTLKRMEGEFAGSNHTLNLIHEYLLKERKQ